MIAERIINNKIEQSQSVLDIGCGRGIYTRTFYQYIVGVDILDQDVIHYNKYIKHNLENGLPKLKQKFDLVVAKDILEHLTQPLSLLKEVNSKVLNEGGTIVVKVPDYKSKNAWADYTHIRPYTKGAIVKMIEDAGFKVEKVVRLGGYFLPNLIPQAMSWLVVARK